MQDEMFFDSSSSKFNEDWFFLQPGNAPAENLKSIPEKARPVSLPHAWNWEGWSYENVVYSDPEGTGWYFKRLDGSLENGMLLKFDGVSAQCEIFLNGNRLGGNLGAHRVFEIELKGLKRDSSDILAVKVVDKPTLPLLPEGSDPVFCTSPRFKLWRIPMGSSLKAGGIWRDVWLVRRGRTFMRPPEVHAQGDKLVIKPDLHGPLDGFRVNCVLTKDGETLAQSEFPASGRSPVLTVPQRKEWRPLHGELYQLDTSLCDASGKVEQTIRQPVAFFDFRIRDSEFHVNGKPYFLRGQNGFPHCNVPYDKEYIAEYVAKIKAQGVEISRFHTEPPSHAWLDECDRQGIMVIFEMALHGSYACYPFGNREFAKTAFEEIRSLFLEYRRHPSIALWCLGNEMIVACERDIGLGAPLFDVLDSWIKELRRLDPRPIIASSCSDAANLLHKSVGDVDDVHQYGGWYVENLRDLRNFGHFTRKDDMLFQPCISTESIAAYTDEEGKFFIKHGDVRQRKMVAMRLGKIDNLVEQSQRYQSFLLKEYSEAMWRLRAPDSSFAGYLPFGQYTWFFKPFEKGPDGLKEKRIWETYRKVMGPVHVQFECWDRNLTPGGFLEGTLHLFHESLELPEKACLTLKASCSGKVFLEREVEVSYHRRIDIALKLGPFSGRGPQRLELEVFHGGVKAAWNDLEFNLREATPKRHFQRNLLVYDPAGRLELDAKKLPFIGDALTEEPQGKALLFGPHSLDAQTSAYAEALKSWIAKGGRAIVLEQNPSPFTEDVLNCGIGFMKTTQPYWSRWAVNLVKHADRADMVDPSHPVFAGLSEDDLKWWNGDSFLAHCYLRVKTAAPGDRILSRIGNGLADDELMPVQYDFVEAGYSLIMLERKIGAGSLLVSSLLLGGKAASDPVAARMLDNLLRDFAN